MKANPAPGGPLFLLFFLLLLNCGPATAATDPEAKSESIPWSQLGAKAGADYKGDGLSVMPTVTESGTAAGARLRCVFQRLEGQATTEGLWLTSTVPGQSNDRFRVTATSVGRTANAAKASAPRSATGDETPPRLAGEDACATRQELPLAGTVTVEDKLVRFLRPGLIEEYSVSVDGVRQDFVVLEKPGGSGHESAQNKIPQSNVRNDLSRLTSAATDAGALLVELAVTGAKVEPLGDGARLVLDGSGRKIAYSRLRVTDATGRELPARIEVSEGARHLCRFDAKNAEDFDNNSNVAGTATLKRPEGRAPMLAVLVNDADAVYPIRIDPTFSDANWISMGDIRGANGRVRAAVVDGSGCLCIGGSFTIVGDVLATNIARWNGSSWSALGSGINGRVNALAVSGGDLYAGGQFTTAGAVAANHIAKWNGHSWSALGSGMGGDFDFVSALAVSGNDLYAGGQFTAAGGASATNIARWDGNSWSALGSGMNQFGYVYALAVSGGDLYAGGAFTTADSVAANRIARWNGSSWSALGSGMNGTVWALAVSGSDLYAGGDFTTAGGVTVNRIAKWDGSSWSALGSEIGGVGNSVYALAVSGSDLYVGGVFTTAGGVAVNRIAKWNGTSWSALGAGVEGVGTPVVWALVVWGTDLYAGGEFTTSGGLTVNHIAKWSGSIWSALGSGINRRVYALAVSGSDLYAGGQFTTAGEVSANGIAKWNGSSWSALGSGIIGWVEALAVSGGDLYVGGVFTTAGGVAANYIAKWDGSGWSALGSGMNNVVYALAVSGSVLYAGGRFTTAGNNIAKWNGSRWSALGSGMSSSFGSSYVSALAVSGSDLYAGGEFTRAGGVTANYIAKWNGSSWSALGSGMNQFGEVHALAVSGSDLYAGGEFTTSGGLTVNRIAKWNGSSWSALGSGMDSAVRALTVSGNVLYAGGRFRTAGGKVSAYVARAYLDLPTLSILRSGDDVTLSWPAAFGRFALQQNPDAANSNGWATANYPLTTNGTVKSVTVPATATNQFFRLTGD